MILADVVRFSVPEAIVQETEKALREAGKQGLELFVLWSGQVRDKTFEVRTAHIPPQTSFKLAEGLLVRVEGEALHKLNLWLFQHEQMLGVQVHAHPGEAFHSGTDDAFPVVTTEGGLSIVAPSFCKDALVANAAIFRLVDQEWVPESPESQLLQAE